MPTFANIQEEISNMLAVADDDLDDSQKQLMDAYLDDLAIQEAGKIDSFGRLIKLEQARNEACEAEGRRLIAKAKAGEKRLDYLKSRYAETMQRHGIKSIKGNAYSLSLRKSERVEVDDLNLLQKEAGQFVKTKVEIQPDKKAIGLALKVGQSVPGCRLVERETLQVR